MEVCFLGNGMARGQRSNSMIESLEIVSQNVKIEKQGSTEIERGKRQNGGRINDV